MINNDIIRRLRYTFDLNDSTMIEIFGLADMTVTRAQVSSWLKKDNDDDYLELSDIHLATFLNGFINLKRGKKEGPQPQPEERLNNNIVLRKLKIALSLKDEDILELLETMEIKISKHELSAFFRNPSQSQYRHCKDQILRNFLYALQKKHKPNPE